jgi:hypothetical protein
LELGTVNSTNPWGERELKKTIMRSASNGFHGGLFKKNKKKKKKKKKLLCTFVCLSLGLKKLEDFTVSEGHEYTLVVRGRLNQRQGMLMHCKLYLWRLYFCQILILKRT